MISQLHTVAIKRAVRELGVKFDPLFYIGLLDGVREVDYKPDIMLTPCRNVVPHDTLLGQRYSMSRLS
jgi:hypothetical protein